MRRSWRFAAAITVAAVLAGCGGGGDGGDNAQPDEAEQTETTAPALDRSATVTYALSTGAGGWDPALGRNPYQDALYLNLVYDRLLHLDHEGKLVPLAATEWETSEDGLTITLTLKDGMTFHDGTPVTAGAVVASIERAKTLPGSSAAASLSNIAEVKAPDDQTVEVLLVEPDPATIFSLATSAASIVNPAAMSSGADLSTTPAGSGPFQLLETNPTSSTFERYADYHDEESIPSARLVMLAILDVDSRLNAIRSGQADAGQLSSNEATAIDEMVATGDFVLHTYNTSNLGPLYLNSKIEPLDDPKVRLALNHAIDRDALNETIMHGQCPPASATFQKGFIGHVEGLEYEYDVERAKELLAEAGVPDGFTLSTLGTQTEPYKTFLTVVKDMLGKIGVRVEVTTLEPAAIRPTFRTGNHAAASQAFSTLSPDPSAVMDGLYLGPDNPGGVAQDIKDAAAAARALPIDSDERAEAYQELNRRLFEEPSHVFLCGVPNLYVGNTAVTGLDKLAYSRTAPIADIRYLGKKRT